MQSKPPSLDARAVHRTAFSILIAFLEREAPDQFLRALDKLCIGFRESGPVPAKQADLQIAGGVLAYTKLSDVPGVLGLREKIELFCEALTPDNAEMLLQSDLLKMADAITQKVIQ
jgi:hypothetical protein